MRSKVGLLTTVNCNSSVNRDYLVGKISVVKEDSYYRVYLDFTTKAVGKKACKDMIRRPYIVNYYFY